MKAYIEYEDGTFWAIRTEDNNCFTTQGGKYKRLKSRAFKYYVYLLPELMLKAGTEDEKEYDMPLEVKKMSFENPSRARKEAAKLINERSVKNENGASALKQDGEFWRDAVQVNACLLFFVPDEYRTKELCALAVGREGQTLRYVPTEMRDGEIYKLALNNFPGLEFIPNELITEEMCLNMVKTNCGALDDVPEKFITAELCLIAVRGDGRALEYVPEKFKTAELCTEAVKNKRSAFKFVPAALKTLEFCFFALRRPDTNRAVFFSYKDESNCVL